VEGCDREVCAEGDRIHQRLRSHCVNHFRLYILVTQQILHCLDVVTIFTVKSEITRLGTVKGCLLRSFLIKGLVMRRGKYLKRLLDILQVLGGANVQ
jgi:hypothetical protein